MLALAGLFVSAIPLHAQLLSNLQAFPDRIAVGDPLIHAADSTEGPKGLRRRI